MIKVDETQHFNVFSEGHGSSVKLQRKRDLAAVILESEDAEDMLDKLQGAANELVKDYWIDAWSNFFAAQPSGLRTIPKNMKIQNRNSR